MINKFKPKSFIELNLFFFLPLFGVISVEFIQRDSLASVLHWIKFSPTEFLLNYVCYFVLMNIFVIFSRRFYLLLSGLIVLMLNIISYVSKVKESYRGEPLQPWDLKLDKEATGLKSYFFESINIQIILYFVAILFLICIGIKFLGNKKYNYKLSFLLGLSSIGIICGTYFNKPLDLKSMLNIQYIDWSPIRHYDQNGLLYGFIQSLEKLNIEAPNSYSELIIHNIMDDLKNSGTKKDISSTIKPNIIFVMSESFWDPTVLDGINFSEDPIPYFRKLKNEYPGGELLANVYGGGTANTEFEVLTGFSTQFLPVGITPYTMYLNQSTHSMAWVLREQGYYSTAMHSYENWFYNRDNVYKHLGFDEFMPFEFYINPTFNGEYIEDIHLMDNIIEKVKETPDRDFIYAVTMEGHGPYQSVSLEENKIEVRGPISESSKEILESYVSKLKGADKSLEFLIEKLKDHNEPTVVVFFGDHLPSLGKEFQVYKETGFLGIENDYLNYLNTYTVPFVIWDNFLNDSRSNLKELRMSMNFISPFILDYTENKKSDFFNYIDALYNRGVQVVPKQKYLSYEGLDVNDLENYKLLQYDMLFGENYYSENFDKNKNYQLKGTKDFKVEMLSPRNLRRDMLSNPLQDQSRVVISVENLPFMTNVYLNKERVYLRNIEGNVFEFTIPQKFLSNKEEVNVDFKVVDTHEKVLKELETIKIKVEDSSYIELFKDNAKSVILDGENDWEIFSENEKYTTLRLQVNLKTYTEYILFQNNKEFIQSNADDFSNVYMSDIYENEYLYITLDSEELRVGLKEYFNAKPLNFYYK